MRTHPLAHWGLAVEGATLDFLPVPHGFVFIGPLHLF